MSIAMIVFLVLSIVLLGMGIYGGSVQIPDAAAVEAGAKMPGAFVQSIAQLKNFNLILGARNLMSIIHI